VFFIHEVTDGFGRQNLNLNPVRLLMGPTESFRRTDRALESSPRLPIPLVNVAVFKTTGLLHQPHQNSKEQATLFASGAFRF